MDELAVVAWQLQAIRDCADPGCSLCDQCCAILWPRKRKRVKPIPADDPVRIFRRPGRS